MKTQPIRTTATGSCGSKRLSERIRAKTKIPSLVREAAEIKETVLKKHCLAGLSESR